MRLDRAVIPEDDRVFLRKRWVELRDKFEELRFETPKGPVHGDAHVQNLMVDDRDQVILIDFEAFCFDHPEWDLMVTAVEHHSLGWQTDEQYAEFVGAYGRDLFDWHGYETLRGLQEFGMTTWLMQNVQEDERTAAEYPCGVSLGCVMTTGLGTGVPGSPYSSSSRWARASCTWSLKAATMGFAAWMLTSVWKSVT